MSKKSPAYRVADRRIAAVRWRRARGFASAEEAGFTTPEGFCVSSPKFNDAFHLDSEDNFFVQIHGEKFFHIYDNFRPRSLVGDADIERAMTKHRNLRYDPAFDVRSVSCYRMNCGDGCYVP